MTPHPASAASRQAGFTLVELLISMLILSLIIVISAGALRTGGRIWELSADAVSRAETRLAIRRVLRDQISRMAPLSGRFDRFDRAGERPLIEGTSDRIAFVAPLPSYYGRMGLYRIEYRLEDDALIFSRSPLQTTTDFIPAPDTVIDEEIVKGVAALHFRYLGGRRGRLNWVDDTTGFDEIPKLVELRIQFLDERENGDWPPLVIATRIDTAG